MRSLNRLHLGAVHQRCITSSHLNLRCGRPKRSGLAFRTIRAQASQDDSKSEPTSLAPVKPKTPYGQMLEYMLKVHRDQPELFRTAVEDQLRRLKEEKDARAEGSTSESEDTDKSQLILYQRMEELRASEMRATIEDLMYVSIMEKFVGLGVEMLPRMDGFVDAPANLKALTEGIHSREALELVREHLIGVMGPAAQAQFSNAALKMSKFQMAQVYAASIMFGYFLRRVDTRFQLEKVMGSLTPSKEDAVARLERLFSQADTHAPWEEPLDTPSTSSTTSAAASPSSTPAPQVEDLDSVPTPSTSAKKDEDEAGMRVSDWVVGGSAASSTPVKKQKSALRRYVESFDQQTMVETARIVSIEGAALVERQTSALVGDIKKLTAQVQEAVGTDVTSMQDVMDRMAQAVRTDAIETLTMTVGTQRRAVLEAVAFGTFLRDVETSVETEYGLLTIRKQLVLPGSDDSDE